MMIFGVDDIVYVKEWLDPCIKVACEFRDDQGDLL